VNRIDLQLAGLTLSEKLDLLETIWADLSRDENSLESPAWHEPILREREEAFESGELVASDWGEAKKRIGKNVL
jgi:Putative addiction module component